MREKVSNFVDQLQSRIDSARLFLESRNKEFRLVTLFIVLALGLFTRLFPLRQITLSDASYSLTEAYRNLRNIRYTGENFPAILFTDLSSSVPSEIATGTGGVIDLLLGAVVAIGGSETAIPLLHIVPVISFVLLFAIVYKIASQLFNPALGVLAVTIMTIIPGGLYSHTVAGSGSVVGFEIAILLGFVYALYSLFNSVLANVSILESVSEDYKTKDVGLKIIATTVLGVLTVGVTPQIALIVFSTLTVTVLLYALRNSRDIVQYEPISLSLLIPSVAMTLTVAGLSTVFTETIFGVSNYSLTQVLFGIVLVMTLLGVIAIPRYQEQRLREQDRWDSKSNFTTEFSVFGVIVGAALLGVVQYTVNILESVNGLLESSGQATQSGSTPLESLVLNEFGLILFGAVIGALALYSARYRRSHEQQYGVSTISTVYVWDLLVLTLAGVTSIAYAFDQSYSALLGVFIAIFTVNIIKLVIKYGDLNNPDVSGIKTYQVILIIMVLVLFIPGLFAPLDGTVVQQAQAHEVQEQSTIETAGWIQDAESINSESIYQNPQESPNSVIVSADNPEVFAGLGEYPTTGETEESREFTSRFLLSQSEEEAEQIASQYGTNPDYVAIDSSTALTNSEFITLTRDHPDKSYQDFSQSVFSATTGDYTYNVNSDEYYNSLINRLYFYHGAAQRPEGTTVAYQQNAEQNRATTYEVDQLLPEDHIRKFESQSEADRYIKFHSGELRQQIQEESDEELSEEELDQRMSEAAEELGTEQSEQSLSIQQGGVGIAPTTGVDALENYRYIGSSETGIQEDSLFLYQYQQIQRYMEEPRPADFLVDPAKTKVFERVQGATVEGSNAPANSRVIVRVTLENTQTDIQFRYVQQVQTDDNGNFETTLPYATENLPEEYTVRPYENAEYEFISQQLSLEQGEDGELSQNITRYEATQSISEEEVQNGGTTSVTLEEVENPEQSQDQDSSEDQSN